MDRWLPSSERYDIEMSLAQRTVHEIKKCDPRWDARIETRDGAVYAIGTVVERTTRFTMLVRLPRKDGWGKKERVKNGPALGGYGAESMREALTDGFAELPDQLRRSLTWDRGKELAQHAHVKIDTGLDVFFADPHSPGSAA